MNVFSHIPFTELAELAEGHSTATPDALEHLSSCAQCSSQLESIRKTIALMRSDTAEDAPVELVATVKNYPRTVVTRQPSLVHRIVASLTFDSLTTAPAFGLRSQTAAGRQLIYSTETADIDVRVTTENEEWQIAGQVLGAECATGDVDLQGDSFSASAKLNELCEFSFGSVPAGTYKISVRLPDVVIETPRLELGP
jgi:hypothetical protein